jgi:hypothetical protein
VDVLAERDVLRRLRLADVLLLDAVGGPPQFPWAEDEVMHLGSGYVRLA